MIEEHPLYNSLSVQLKRLSITLGCEMIKTLGFPELSEEQLIVKYNTCNNKDLYEERLSLSKENYETQILNIKQNAESKISELQNKITELSLTKENEINKHVSKIEESYKERIKLLNINSENKTRDFEKVIHSKDNEIKTLELFRNQFDTKSFKNPTEQGNCTEKVFDDIINEGLPFDDKADIKDTSKPGGSGDRRIIFSNGVKLMVEVKNKDTIKKTDLDEFRNHYEKDFNEKTSDCALFFSNRTQQITSKGKTIVPLNENNRIFYYGIEDNLPTVEKKQKIIRCLNEIYETYKKTDKTINNSVKDNEIYNLFLKNLKNNKTFHKNELKLSEKKVKEHKDKLTEIEQQTSDIDKIIIVNQINVDPSLFDDEIHKKNLIVAIKEWINQEKVKLENKI